MPGLTRCCKKYFQKTTGSTLKIFGVLPLTTLTRKGVINYPDYCVSWMYFIELNWTFTFADGAIEFA
jgi:hypothetical protein